MRRFVYPFLAALIFFSAIPISWAQHDLTLNLVFDQYRSETSWELINGSDEVVAEGDDYGADFGSSGEYPHPPIAIEDLPNGQYEFVIYDAYDDGMCCAYGNGGYTLVNDADGAVIAQGGAFGGIDAMPFTLPYVAPIAGCTDPEAINYDPDAEDDDGSCEYLTSDLEINLELFANGLSSPVAMANAGDDRLFVCEQNSGIVKILDENGDVLGNFINVGPDASSGGERGLLGIAFHPNYAENGYFYLNYTNNQGDTEIIRYTVSESDPNVADDESGMVVMKIYQPYSNHNAGDLKFGPDGYLYIPMGDGGSGGDPENRAQEDSTRLGKILRIDVDVDDFPGNDNRNYGIPTDNPYVGEGVTWEEIWAYGLRNPWRFSFDRQTGDMYIGDVGQNAYEELNMQPANSPGGENYGWRCFEGFNNYNTSGCEPFENYTPPIMEFAQGTFGWCSVIGGYVYRGQDYPLLDGVFLTTDYCNGIIFAIYQNAMGEWQRDTINTQFDGSFGTVAFGEDADGELYVVRNNGNIYRVEEPCSAFIPEITEDGPLLTASGGESYQWLLDGQIIEGATEQTYLVEADGTYSVVVNVGNGCVLESDEITVVVSSIGEPNSFANLNISPNPSRGLVNFSGELSHSGQLNIQMLDATGRLVKELSFGHVSGALNRDLDLSNLSEGVYYVKISLNQSSEVRRLVIVH